MSVVEIATPAEAAALAVPYSVRLAARSSTRAAELRHEALRQEAARQEAARQERRAYARRTARELEWLRGARLRHGPGVSLVDLSEGGALLDADVPLKPGARLVLELEGEGGHLKVPLSVLRSHVARLQGEVMIYRGACAFNAPVDLAVLLSAPPGREPREEFAGVDTAFTHLIERLRTGSCATRADAAVAVKLAAGEVLQILESLQTRVIASGLDAYTRGVGDLLAGVLPELHRGTDAEALATFVDERVQRLMAGDKYASLPSAAQARESQARLVRTASLLKELVQHLQAAGSSEPSRADACETDSAASEPDPAVPVLPTDSGLATAWQRIVVRYREGRLLKGFTQDFHPSRGHFSLWPSIAASRRERVIVPFSRLKAVFFVRDFQGNPRHVDRDDAEMSRAGRRVEVTFVDNEVIRGTTLSYRPDGFGFFVSPADAASNNQRVFVVSAALRHVRFP
jgi:hypothetical protein